MGTQVALIATVCTFVVGVIVIPSVQSSPSNFFQDGDTPVYDYIDNDLQRLLFSERNEVVFASRRSSEEESGPSGSMSCIARGGNCDGRINDCCDCCSCRCNLWGANCRCQRRGLFQKIGK
ncbi:hypothetical protein LSTR_LSTR004055 [Laodelphax striatellus]|uniref:Uncharacterized protein n=1 Tax=Laodelphax striatellus TaxID=195883 RepID=A0A482WFX8_LAOST|nr:hypothetical protein LSTR_LSTR004055 [Laodelphax striatellus]